MKGGQKMSQKILRIMTDEDIGDWLNLSKEYDDYVKPLTDDFDLWYQGNDQDIGFMDYMKAKIRQKEALMVMDENSKHCLGIIGFSKKNNRITFLAVAHKVKDYKAIGQMLMEGSLKVLDTREPIYVNLLKSEALQIYKERILLESFGFMDQDLDFENGVPVIRMCRPKS